jgi:hypothetical protein
MATIKQVSDGGPDGTQIGQTSVDLVGYWGATPVARYATSVPTPSSVVSVSTTATTTYGFGTSTQADALIKAVARIHAALSTAGWFTA